MHGQVMRAAAFVVLVHQGYHHGGIRAAADVGEAADVGDDIAEEVGSFPCGSEGGDAAAADAADGPSCRVGGEFRVLACSGQDFVGEEAGIV